MSRPRICRRLIFKPGVTYFKPAGVPMSELEEVSLMPDEVEALKMCDVEFLKQEDAAKKMQVSQPTFNRALSNARSKIAKAIINGTAIRIEVSE